MPSVAITKDGELIDAERVLAKTWAELKANAAPGYFLMPCCQTTAILKNSINGLQFFAHLSDECRTAPETAWHREGKALIRTKLEGLGIDCQEEVSGGAGAEIWKADALFRIDGRTVVIELQRSYQHINDYLQRQARYERSGVECYWLTRRDNFKTLTGATARLRIKREWAGKFPPGRQTFLPLLPDLPVAVLELGETPVIWNPGIVTYKIEDWLKAIIEKRYYYNDGQWLIK